MLILKKKIISILSNIFDPEIPINIYELGLIYDLRIRNKNIIRILMTLTTPHCPVAESFTKIIKNKIFHISYVKKVDVILTFFPNWTYKFLSELGRLELGV
ncbi:MAG: iron-sulfur cluster assembly protein [Candidatus Karelsulcia muelleri]|nr:MAG: iron-sulfur cluster assembly protein [Candidatus Karelsulcia muelleri]